MEICCSYKLNVSDANINLIAASEYQKHEYVVCLSYNGMTFVKLAFEGNIE